MSVKKALIVGGGQAPATPTLIRFANESELVVGADLGAEHLLKAGKVPDLIIGDMDSCSKGVVSRLQSAGCETIIFNTEKDFTDLEAALDHCVNKGFTDIIVLAAIHGRRTDHVFGNVFLLVKYVKKGIRVRLYDDNGRFIEIIDNEISFNGKVGSFVSLIAISEQVTNINTTGLKYQLQNGKLELGSSLGLSNQLCTEKATINIESGLLLVIKELDS